MFKFFITANLEVRAKNIFNLKTKKKLPTRSKKFKNRDYLDRNRKHSPLKKLKIQS